jgi:hypothetical protein
MGLFDNYVPLSAQPQTGVGGLFDDYVPQSQPQESGIQQFYRENPNVRAWAGGVRDFGPTAVAMTAGGIGGQAMGVPLPVGAGAGGLAYLGTKMVADPATSAYNYLTGSNAEMPTKGLSRFLDQFLPSDEVRSGGMEQVMKGVNDAVADNASAFGAGTLLRETAAAGGRITNALGNLVNPNTTSAVGTALTQSPKMDTALSALSGAASATAKQVAPDSQGTQIAAGVLTPLSVVLAANGIKGGVNAIGAPQALSAFLRGQADDEARLLAERSGNAMTGRRNAAAMQLSANRVAEQVQGAAGNRSEIDSAIANLDESANLYTPASGASPGYNPTSGTASGNTGLLSMEKGLVNSDRLVKRYQDNKRAIDVEMSDQMKPEMLYPASAAPQESQGFIKKILDDELAQSQAGQKNAQQAALDAETNLANKEREVVDMSAQSRRTEPSAQVRSSLEANMQAVSKQVDAEFAKVPQDIAVDIQSARQKAVEILDQFNKSTENAPDVITKFTDLTKKDTVFASGDAQKILQELYAAQGAAGKGTTASRLIGELREALDADITKKESVSEPLRNARNFYRDNFVPVFKSDEAFDVFYGRSKNAPSVAPSETIDAYMGKPEAATQLSRGLQGASGKISDADEALLKNWVESKMASSAGSKPSQESVLTFLRNNDATISRLPESAKKRVLEIAEGLGSAKANVGTTKTALDESNAAFAATEARATKSGAAKFANANEAEYQVDTWLYDNQNARKTMSDLIAEAKKDKTGRALEGLQNAVKNSLGRKIKNPGSNSSNSNDIQAGVTDDWATSLAKSAKVLEKNTPTRRALEMILSKDDLNVLDRGRKQMEVSARINRKATSGSDTAANLEAKSQLQQIAEGSAGRGTATDVLGAKQIRQVNTVIQFVKGLGKGVVVSSNEAKFTDDLLKEAMLDPAIMKALLRRSTPKNLEMTKQAITPFINSWTQANQGQGEGDSESKQQTGKSYRYDPDKRTIVPSE